MFSTNIGWENKLLSPLIRMPEDSNRNKVTERKQVFARKSNTEKETAGGSPREGNSGFQNIKVNNYTSMTVNKVFVGSAIYNFISQSPERKNARRKLKKYLACMLTHTMLVSENISIPQCRKCYTKKRILLYLSAITLYITPYYVSLHHVSSQCSVWCPVDILADSLCHPEDHDISRCRIKECIPIQFSGPRCLSFNKRNHIIALISQQNSYTCRNKSDVAPNTVRQNRNLCDLKRQCLISYTAFLLYM